ncbi:MAG: ABC transporter permease [Negativicutes bacterium]|nr:ABC transporter permease [Negativicutes bacterium]
MFFLITKLYFSRFDFFLGLIGEHILLSTIAIGFATVIGLLLGVLISEFNKTSSYIFGATNFLYTIPSIALLGFLVPFFGIGNTTAVIALTLYALLPMVRNTATGLTVVDPDIIEAARGMGSTKLQLLYKIKLPLALPVILAGFRNMVVMTIALCGIASFIGAGGLGVAIYRGITTNNIPLMIAGSLLISALALISDFFLGTIETLVTDKMTNGRRTQK